MHSIVGILTRMQEEPATEDFVVAFTVRPMFGGEDWKVDVVGEGITMKDALDYIYGKATIQNAFPQLSAEKRESLLTGMTPEEQAEVFDHE
jgi:hypothetical protein